MEAVVLVFEIIVCVWACVRMRVCVCLCVRSRMCVCVRSCMCVCVAALQTEWRARCVWRTSPR